MPYLHPPFVAALYAPLGWLPSAVVPGTMIASAAVLAAALAIALPWSLQLSRRRGLLLAAFVAAFPPLVYAVYLAQPSTLVPLGIVLFYGWSVRGQRTLAGLSLVLLLVKPHYAIALAVVLIARRARTELVILLTAAVVLALASLLVAGPGVLLDYPRAVMRSTSTESNDVMYGLPGFLSLYVSSSVARSSLLILGSLLIALGAALAIFMGGSSQRHLAAQLAAATTASVLLGPHVYFQDLGLAAVAGALGLAASKSSWTHLVWCFTATAFVVGAVCWQQLRLEQINVLTPLLVSWLSLSVIMLTGERFHVRRVSRARVSIRLETPIRQSP
jgi:hypothetical protein